MQKFPTLEISKEGFGGVWTSGSVLLDAPLGVDALLEDQKMSTKFQHNWRQLAMQSCSKLDLEKEYFWGTFVNQNNLDGDETWQDHHIRHM